MLYTRKGDDGTSGLFGTKDRLPKNSPIYDALGSIDELNSLLGICRAKSELDGYIDVHGEIKKVQESLFIIQAELAGAEKTITQKLIDTLEEATNSFEGRIENPHAFVVPGATELSALLDLARAVSRRAERAVITARQIQPVSSETSAYLNRLSSFLYAVARYTATQARDKEISPSY